MAVLGDCVVWVLCAGVGERGLLVIVSGECERGRECLIRCGVLLEGEFGKAGRVATRVALSVLLERIELCKSGIFDQCLFSL